MAIPTTIPAVLRCKERIERRIGRRLSYVEIKRLSATANEEDALALRWWTWLVVTNSNEAQGKTTYEIVVSAERSQMRHSIMRELRLPVGVLSEDEKVAFAITVLAYSKMKAHRGLPFGEREEVRETA